MSLTYSITSVLEIVIGALIIAGLFNEEKLADAEQRIFKKIRRRFSRSKQTAPAIIRFKNNDGSHCA